MNTARAPIASPTIAPVPMLDFVTATGVDVRLPLALLSATTLFSTDSALLESVVDAEAEADVDISKAGAVVVIVTRELRVLFEGFLVEDAEPLELEPVSSALLLDVEDST